ncbi:MAG TPA: hypothetical protein VNY08_02640 [Bradyrhizobium sp.]|nr:hypothetical protein [Bradyrhizobium sp.]
MRTTLRMSGPETWVTERTQDSLRELRLAQANSVYRGERGEAAAPLLNTTLRRAIVRSEPFHAGNHHAALSGGHDVELWQAARRAALLRL